jgi:hypothetical protein
MSVRRGPGAAVLVAALAISIGTAAAASEPVGDSPLRGVVGRIVTQDPADVRAYWTPERMRAAIPMSIGPRARAGSPDAVGKPTHARASDVSGMSAGFPERVHGKVFLTLDADYECSATVVASPAHTLVWTAGHCVNGSDFGLGYARNWIFVPGYRDGERPFGSWTAASLHTTEGWAQESNVRLDVGAAVMGRDGEGRGIEDAVGARGIAFNQPRQQTFEAFGYPASDPNTFLLPPNFNGQRLWLCRSQRTADDTPSASSGPPTMEINCNMTSGSSGGAWVIGNEFVNSVTSYGYQLDNGHLYGPYMGTVAEDLYRSAGGSASLCAGRPATNVGGAAIDDFNGTKAADSFVLKPGDDRASGRGGSDTACGSGGNDRLLGGPKADILRGSGGNDMLIGGPGRDVCVGGPGRDRAFGCEKRRGIP